MAASMDQTCEYEIPASPEEVAGEGNARLPARIPSGVVVAAAAWTLYGLLTALLLRIVIRGEPTWSWIVVTAVAQALFWAAATPGVAWLARNVEPRRVGRVATVLVHAAAAALCAVGVVVTRQWAQALAAPYMAGRLLPQILFWLDVNVLTYVTTVIVARAIHLHRRYRRRAVRAHRLELQLARAQMQFLELQLQPHFLFNCLNAVSELAHEAPEAAERMLRQLRALLRVSLDRAGRDEVTLDEELEGLQPYLDIQRTRFSDWLVVEQHIDDDARDALVPHLILQPLVENAIRHGLAVRSGPGTVWVQASVDGDRLRLVVRDDGVGLAPAPIARRPGRSGIGLRNTRERLRQLYDPEYRLVLRAAPQGGTIVELEIPLRRRDANGRTPALPGGRDRALDLTHEHTAAFRRPAASVRTPLALVPSGAALAADDPQSALVTGGWAAARRPSPTTAAPPAPADESRDAGIVRVTPRFLLASLLGWALIGLVWTEQIYLFVLARMGRVESVGPLLRINLIAAGLWFLLTPVVLWLANHMRVGRDRGVWPILGHVAAAFGLAAAHVALYSFLEHDGPVRVFIDVNQNQLTGNVIIYFAIVAWAHSREFYAWFRERELAASRIEAALARSRYQAMCVQLRPQLLLGTLERLGGLVHEDVPRAERLIARLADVLRMTLDSASDAVTTLRKELELLRAYVEVYELGVRQRLELALDVPSELLGTPVPNRLLRAILDDMLAGLPLAAPAWVSVDAERSAHATRIRVRLDSESPKHGADGVEPWSVSVEAAALAEADRRVSLFFPDSRSALIVLADDLAAETAPRESDPMPAAQPA